MSRYSNRSTYFPSTNTYGMSQGLLRARRPFLFRNLVTGTVIAGFVGSVYLYSIFAVKQDEFTTEDINALLDSSSSKTPKPTIKEETIQGVVDLEASIIGGGPLGTRPEDPITSQTIRQSLSHEPPTTYSLLAQTWRNIGFHGKDGNTSVIVKAAPSVDAIGKLGDRTTADGDAHWK